MTVIATAGHVDHGKSTLVRALTGIDPDRWDEEKARGLTIDLGFASLDLPSGTEISLVDVPGHIRFLRNMLAGVGAVDGSLFVVSATDGWKPQSEEHLRILSLLGIRHGVIALTKVDQVDEDLFELAQLDVEEHVEGSFLEGAPVIGVAAPTGLGISDLCAAIDEMVAAIPPPSIQTTPRLWVDRAFAPAGAGTVVTGTLVRGSLAVGDHLQVNPGGQVARVRGLQRHNKPTETIEAGNRVAVNLTGIDHHQIGRGHVLIAEDVWHETTMVDASLTVLAQLGHPVSRRGAYVAYLGSAELPVKVRVLGESVLQPGESGAVRLYLPRSLPLVPGDRYVLRESGRDETVGGGEILDVDPVLPASKAKPTRSLDRLVRERGWVHADYLARISGEMVEPTVGTWVVAPEVLQLTIEEVQEKINEAGPLGLDIAELDDRQRAALDLVENVSIAATRAKIGDAPDPLADHPWVAALDTAGFQPPGPDGVDRAEVRELVRRGTVVEQDGVYFAASTIERATSIVGELATEHPDGFTVAQARDAFATTRKYVLPLLGYLDRTGITQRNGDFRMPGRRHPLNR